MRPPQAGVITSANKEVLKWKNGKGAAGLAQALGRLLAIVLTEAISGRWSRLKARPRDVCHWALYDHSRSHTGTWCTMAVCGSRVKAPGLLPAPEEEKGRLSGLVFLLPLHTRRKIAIA